MTDLITAIYAQLWALLENNSVFTTAVVSEHRVKINFSQITPGSTQQAPVQYTAPEDDSSFPQVSILLSTVEHSGKAQSARMGDQKGLAAAGRLRSLTQAFELIIIHKGFDVPTNSALKLACIDALEAASTGLGLLPFTSTNNVQVVNVMLETITGRDEYGSWEGGSTLRNKTTLRVPVKITFIGPAFPVTV